MLVPFAFRAIVAPVTVALGLAVGVPLAPERKPPQDLAPSASAGLPRLRVDTGSRLTILPGTGDPITLGLEELRALKRTQFTTTTIWTDGSHHFTGVALADLLAHLDMAGRNVKALALNDYAAVIPARDLRAAPGPIIAYEMDGAPLPRRGFGPFWLIYPYDSDISFRTESIYARSVTQLNRLRLEP